MAGSDRAMLFGDTLRFRAEAGLHATLRQAAQRQRTTVSEYIRRAVRDAVQADGLALPPLPSAHVSGSD